MNHLLIMEQIRIIETALKSDDTPKECINALRLAKNILEEQKATFNPIDYMAHVPTLDNY